MATSPARARHHAHRVGVHGRDAAADGLGYVEECQAEPEADVGRPDDAEVEGAETNEWRVKGSTS